MFSAFPLSKAYRLINRALVSGSIASLGSALALTALGKKELNKSAAPMNGPSQWIWGKHAPYMNEFSMRYTVIGYLIHHAASIFWALWHQVLCERIQVDDKKLHATATAVAITASAYAVDFHLIPKRLTPGFEHRLSKRSLILVYGVFALGLAAPALLESRQNTKNRKCKINKAT